MALEDWLSGASALAAAGREAIGAHALHVVLKPSMSTLAGKGVGMLGDVRPKEVRAVLLVEHEGPLTPRGESLRMRETVLARRSLSGSPPPDCIFLLWYSLSLPVFMCAQVSVASTLQVEHEGPLPTCKGVAQIARYRR